MTTIDRVVSDSDEYDLTAPDVEAHTLVEVPIYGLPTTLPDTADVRVLIGGVSFGRVDNTDDGQTILALLFDNGAFRLDGWRIVVAKPVEFQPIEDR